MAGLLIAWAIGVTPSATAECGDLDDRCTYPDASDGLVGAGGLEYCGDLDPGAPGGGAVNATVWFAGQNLFLACGFVDSEEDSVLLHGGNIAWKLGVVASGGAELFDLTGLTPAAVVYASTAGGAAVSQAQDTCAALIGETNPTCGADPGVSQTLQCPGGLAIPNPVGGGLLGDSLNNANGALQATCVLVGAGGAAAPNETQISDFSEDVQIILLELNGDIFALASDASDALCIYLDGDTPCA